MNIDPQITTKHRGQTWAKVKPTTGRNGSWIPVNGYRTFNKKDRVIPQDVHTLKGEEFDELSNFSNSDVGELASTIAKDKSYYIYGFRGYVKVTRPCLFCEKANNKNCACDPS